MNYEFDDPILTVPEVAKYLKMSESKIHYKIQRNEIPYIRIDRNVRIRYSDLLQWLDELASEAVQHL